MPSVLRVSDLRRVLVTETFYIYHLACATFVPFFPRDATSVEILINDKLHLCNLVKCFDC